METGESILDNLPESMPMKSDKGYSLSSPQEHIPTDADASLFVLDAFRFFDLPTEVRHMIYYYLHDSTEINLRYYWEEPKLSKNSDLGVVPTKRSRISGLPSAPIHQASRSFALDAGPIWYAKSSTLTINNEA